MRMRYAAAGLVALALTLAACGGTSSNTSIDTDDIVYRQDTRTGLCFAFVGSGPAMSVQTTGIAMAQVPCTEKVLAQLPD